MLRVLVTGFRPWTGVTYNPSGVVARRLDGARLTSMDDGHPHAATVHGVVLDVAWSDGQSADGASVQSAISALAAAAGSIEPHLIVSFGVSPSDAYTFDVEPQASDRSQGADVLGRQPNTARFYPDLPETLALTFPAARIRDALKAALPEPFTAVSEPGLGYYLCERVAYEGARLQRMRRPQRGTFQRTWIWASGFIHVPNPLFAVRGDSAADVATLTDEEQRKLRAHEDEVVRGATLALRTAIGALPRSLR